MTCPFENYLLLEILWFLCYLSIDKSPSYHWLLLFHSKESFTFYSHPGTDALQEENGASISKFFIYSSVFLIRLAFLGQDCLSSLWPLGLVLCLVLIHSSFSVNYYTTGCVSREALTSRMLAREADQTHSPFTSAWKIYCFSAAISHLLDSYSTQRENKFWCDQYDFSWHRVKYRTQSYTDLFCLFHKGLGTQEGVKQKPCWKLRLLHSLLFTHRVYVRIIH